MEREKTAKKAAKKRVGKTANKASKKRVSSASRRPAIKTTKKTGGKNVRKRPSGTSKKTPNPAPTEKHKRPILVPLDFSAHSQAALEYAADLAGLLHTPLAVLHVVHDPGEAPGYYHVKGRKKQLRRLEDVAKEMLDEFMDEMIKRHPECVAMKNAERLLVTGLPVTRILEIANKLEPKMVIMGSAGRTAISRFLLGSKTEQLLRICPFPVTIVKAPNNEK